LNPARAGFKEGDLIVEADGRPVPHAARLNGILGTIPAGEEIALKVSRDGATVDLKAQLASRDGDVARPQGAWLGIRMGTVPDGKEKDGVPVEEVESSSPAESAGLKVGDRITHVGGKAVGSINEVVSEISGRRPGARVTIKVVRDGKPLDIEVKLGKREKKPEDDD
jgi:S1-C subfamily serine protease